MIRLALLWNLSLLLLPVLLPQAAWVRWRTPRLPEAGAGIQTSEEAAELRILGIGESTIAGVGVECLDQALTAQAGHALQARLGKRVEAHACGRNGALLADLLTSYHELPRARFDAVILAMGVNDTTGLTSLLNWSRQLIDLLGRLKISYEAPIFVCSVPPMHHFTALPQPLRGVLGLRARLLSHILMQTANALKGVYYVNPPIPLEPRYLATDGYHPSAAGYRFLGEAIASAMVPIMQPTVTAQSER